MQRCRGQGPERRSAVRVGVAGGGGRAQAEGAQPEFGGRVRKPASRRRGLPLLGPHLPLAHIPHKDGVCRVLPLALLIRVAGSHRQLCGRAVEGQRRDRGGVSCHLRGLRAGAAPEQ